MELHPPPNLFPVYEAQTNIDLHLNAQPATASVDF